MAIAKNDTLEYAIKDKFRYGTLLLTLRPHPFYILYDDTIASLNEVTNDICGCGLLYLSTPMIPALRFMTVTLVYT